MDSCLSFGAKLLRKARPKTPHKGFISSILVLVSTLGILGILSFMACHRLYVHGSSSEGGERSLRDSFQGITRASEGDSFGVSEGASNSFGISEGANAFGFTTSFVDVDKDLIDPSIYHSFGSPCFVLDS